MTAESDIAAIDTGGANTAAEVRTALTSVLERADARYLIEEVLLASDANFIEIDNIPQTFDHLRVDYQLRASHTGNSAVHFTVGNGTVDTSANAYRWWSTGAATGSSAGDTKIGLAWARVPPPADTWRYAKGDYYLHRYTQAEARYFWGFGTAPNTQGGDWGQWTNTTDAIDIIRLTSDNPPFKAGSRVRLYGLNDLTP